MAFEKVLFIAFILYLATGANGLRCFTCYETDNCVKPDNTTQTKQCDDVGYCTTIKTTADSVTKYIRDCLKYQTDGCEMYDEEELCSFSCVYDLCNSGKSARSGEFLNILLTLAELFLVMCICAI